MSSKPLIAVVGADGFVGGGLAETLRAQRVVYGPARDGDIHISQAQGLLAQAGFGEGRSLFICRARMYSASRKIKNLGTTHCQIPPLILRRHTRSQNWKPINFSKEQRPSAIFG